MNCHLLLQLTCLPYLNRLSFPRSLPRHIVDTELFTQYDVMVNLLILILVLVITILMYKVLFYNKFIIRLYMLRALCAHHQEVKILLYSIWYHHTCMWPSRAQVERRLLIYTVVNHPV